MNMVEDALKWIVELLHKHNVSFQVIGGLAARAHGSTRELYDIDMYIDWSKFSDLLPEIKEYMLGEPETYIDNHWDCTVANIEYHGQRIELADAGSTKIFDTINKKWVPQHIDFSSSEMIEVSGVKVPIMPKQQLITYKSLLGRDVDKKDIQEIKE